MLASLVAYAALYPGPIPVSSTVIRDAVIFAVLAIIADEMSVEISDRVTLAAFNLPILLAIMFTGRLAGHLRRRCGGSLGRVA